MDTRGRVRVTRERREALLTEYERMGMSGAAFARWSGVKYPTLMNWLAQRRKEPRPAKVKESEPLTWVEAQVGSGGGEVGADRHRAAGADGLVIEFGCGARMRVGDRMAAGLAAEVLRELGRRSGC